MAAKPRALASSWGFPPEVEEAEAGEGGEEEAGEDDGVGTARHELAPPVEEPLEGADHQQAGPVHHPHPHAPIDFTEGSFIPRFSGSYWQSARLLGHS